MGSFALFGGVLLSPGLLLQEGDHHGGHADEDEDDADGTGHERQTHAGVALIDELGLTQRLLRHGAQDQAQDHGGGVEAEIFEKVPQGAEDQHDDHVHEGLLHGVGADDAQHGHAGSQDVAGHQGHHGEMLRAGQTDEQHEHIGDEDADDEGVGDAGLGLEQGGSRGKALDHKGAHEHGGDGVAGDAQCQHGDQRAAGDGVVGGLGVGDGFPGAVAEGFRVLGEDFTLVIGQPGGGVAAGAGDDADDDADEGGADIGDGVADQVLEGKPLVPHLLHLLPMDDALLVGADHGYDLRHGIEADEGRHQGNAGEQLGDLEGEPGQAHDGVRADEGQRQAEHAAHETL